MFYYIIASLWFCLLLKVPLVKCYLISCSDAPVGEDGLYLVQPVDSGPVYTVYCDMTTDGGGWMLILNYIHEANDDRSIDENTIPLEYATSYSNIYLSDMGYLLSDVQEVRFYCHTSAHARVLHFKTDISAAVKIAYNKNGADNTAAPWTTDYTALSGHSAYLPAQTSKTHTGTVQLAGYDSFPFYTSGYYWAVRGSGNRFACDDDSYTSFASTHRVFVRISGTPTVSPTAAPTASPTAIPTASPTAVPTAAPTMCGGFNISSPNYLDHFHIAPNSSSFTIEWAASICTSAFVRFNLCFWKNGGGQLCSNTHTGIFENLNHAPNSGIYALGFSVVPASGDGYYTLDIVDDSNPEVHSQSSVFALTFSADMPTTVAAGGDDVADASDSHTLLTVFITLAALGWFGLISLVVFSYCRQSDNVAVDSVAVDNVAVDSVAVDSVAVDNVATVTEYSNVKASAPASAPIYLAVAV